ncbi:hypothetical protein [Pedobacter sp. P26]|uniref:hypothetical protein n=1 Tax=Pedobacter sp. P26 TaxID=3423956 RepID=UPI003D6653C5
MLLFVFIEAGADHADAIADPPNDLQASIVAFSAANSELELGTLTRTILKPIPFVGEKAVVLCALVKSPVQATIFAPPKPLIVCCTVDASIDAVPSTVAFLKSPRSN